MHRRPIRFPCALHPAIGSLPRNSLACSAAGGAAAVSPLDSLSPVRKRASPPKAGGAEKFYCSFCKIEERRLSNLSGKVVKVSGPLVVATGLADANMSDVVRVGPQRLIGEILTMKGDTANIQV